MELQSQLPALKARGLGLAAISYDAPATLADFAARRGITFPLLSDTGSAVIKRYGLLNAHVDPASPQYGIPYPGTFVLDARGIVTARFFEENYQERNTVSSILVRTAGAAGAAYGTQATTAHLTLAASASDGLLAPGTHVSLIVDVMPKPKMHVYAPGANDYQPITLTVTPPAGVRVHETKYPKSEILFFEPLNERVPVYAAPFRLVRDIVLDASPQAQAQFRQMQTLTVNGKIDYQACDDKICYLPASVPLTWTFQLRTLDMERVRK